MLYYSPEKRDSAMALCNTVKFNWEVNDVRIERSGLASI